MSVYGNIIKECDEIDYIYKVASEGALLFDNINIDSFSGNCIMEGLSFHQLKESAKKLLNTLIEKIDKLIKWIKSKVKEFFKKLKIRIKEARAKILNKNGSLKDIFEKLENELEHNKIDETYYLYESVTIGELKEFIKKKTKIGSKIDDFISYCKSYIEDNDGKNSIEYNNFSDFIDTLHLQMNPIEKENNGISYGDFIFWQFDKKIDKLWNYCYYETDDIEKDLNEKLKILKERLSKVENVDELTISPDKITSKYSLISYGLNYDIDKRERTEKEIENISKRLAALPTTVAYMMDYCLLVERTNEECIKFTNKAQFDA